MNVLKQINTLRLDRGWSIYRLSVESGIPQSTLTNMFNRETLPSITTLENICRAFGITMADFFSMEQEEKPSADESLDFLQMYEALSPSKKKALLNIMKELL